jgi:hypothetical protein
MCQHDLRWQRPLTKAVLIRMAKAALFTSLCLRHKNNLHEWFYKGQHSGTINGRVCENRIYFGILLTAFRFRI